MHTHTKGRQSLCLKQASHTTSSLFSADVAAQSTASGQKVVLSRMTWSVSFLVGETENSVS